MTGQLLPSPALSRAHCSPELVSLSRRYGALKTLGEKKAAFHEYTAQRKKEEAEEARARRVKVRVVIFYFIIRNIF